MEVKQTSLHQAQPLQKTKKKKQITPKSKELKGLKRPWSEGEVSKEEEKEKDRREEGGRQSGVPVLVSRQG